jgi:hypothetical protein
MMRDFVTAIMTDGIPNYVISRKIDNSVDMAREEIDFFYDRYRKDILFFAILNGLFLIISIISSLANSIRTIGIGIASILLFAQIFRSLFILIRYLKRIIPYRTWLADFISSFRKKHSIQKAVKSMLRHIWQKKYCEMTNGFTVKIHSFFANRGLIKSTDEMENEFMNKHYYMIREYFVGNIMRKVLIIFIILGVYAFVLQPIVIRLTLGMRLTDIMFYPVRLIESMVTTPSF